MSGIRINAMDLHLDARSVNAIVKDVLGRKAQTVTKNPDLRKEIGEQFIETVTPYVPKKTGKLRDHAYATSDGRIWWTAEYAGYQHDTQYQHYTTPGTGPNWEQYATPDGKDFQLFLDAITPIIMRRFNDG